MLSFHLPWGGLRTALHVCAAQFVRQLQRVRELSAVFSDVSDSERLWLSTSNGPYLWTTLSYQPPNTFLWTISRECIRKIATKPRATTDINHRERGASIRAISKLKPQSCFGVRKASKLNSNSKCHFTLKLKWKPSPGNQFNLNAQISLLITSTVFP